MLPYGKVREPETPRTEMTAGISGSTFSPVSARLLLAGDLRLDPGADALQISLAAMTLDDLVQLLSHSFLECLIFSQRFMLFC